MKKWYKVFVIVCIAMVLGYNYIKQDENIEIVNVQNVVSISNVQSEKEKIKVYVIGEVKKSGVVELNEGDRIEDAITLSGGTTEKSDLSKINLAQVLEDGDKIKVPSIDDIEEFVEEKESKINLNTASESELSGIPGIGISTANKIIEYRKQNGKFKNIDELKNVNGIGEKKYESIKEYLCVK